MDYPHGHYNTSHHSHNRREEEHPPPPQVHQTSHAPPVYTVNDPHPPPPPQVHHTSHVGPAPNTHHSPAPAPPHVPTYSPPPPAAAEPHHRPQPPSASSHNTHSKTDELANKPSVRMFCKAETNYSLTIRDGKVVLAPSNSADPHQHWIKDEKFSTRVKDEEGFPSFALVNKATGQAMKHSVGATQPVELTHYNSNALDESVLWTESKDLGDGYRAIRMVSNIRLNVDAFNGDKKHGGVHDGTRIVLWEWKKDANQRWKIVPYCGMLCKCIEMVYMRLGSKKGWRKSRGGRRRLCLLSDDYGAKTTPVYLNVYDLTPFNAYVYWAGLGVFHSGVQVHGVEYAYGAHDSPSSGIFEVEPRRCPGYHFRKSIRIGTTSLDAAQVRDFMECQAATYGGDTYDLFDKNCNHFCKDVCYKLTGRRIPAWVNRLAKLASVFNCILPEAL